MIPDYQKRFATYLGKEEEAWFYTREAERLERFENTYDTVRKNGRTSAQVAAEHAARDSHLKHSPAPIDLHWYEEQARRLDSKDPAERLEAARSLVAKQHELQEAQRRAAERQLAASARIYQALQKDGLSREAAERVTQRVLARGEQERGLEHERGT
jgi:hypothetical protein